MPSVSVCSICDLLIDVFSERGLTAVVDINKADVPEKLDFHTGQFHCRQNKIIRVRIQFKGSEIRHGG